MNICVFCASSNNLNEVFRKDANTIGELIGMHAYTLVYGGTNMGLMKIVATAASQNGANVIGIIPDSLRENVEQKALSQVFFVEDIAERKALMMEYADVFVVLPGGIGTLDEMTEVMALAQIREHNKKIILLNTSNIYQYLLSHIELCVKEKIVDKSVYETLLVANNPADCFEMINTIKKSLC